MKHNIKHLAIIMDGNARWAQKNNETIAEGHAQGATRAKELIPAIIDLNVPYLTLYTFSAENWSRSSHEISMIIELLKTYIIKEASSIKEKGVRLKFIGDISRLDIKLQQQLEEIVQETANNSTITLCIAFSYGGKQEIVAACNRAIKSGVDSITESDLQSYMYDPKMPDVDLMIRTGGDHRISNFLIWQSAYAEFYIIDKYWPEFTKDDLLEAINNFQTRKRNFGKRI